MKGTSLRLLDNTGEQLEVVGSRVKALGYFGSSNGMHTVAMYVQDFTGQIVIEASLVESPEPGDWHTVIVKQFPLDPLNPTGENQLGDTVTVSENFQGNFVWVRARVTREYLDPYPPNIYTGSVRKILINY